MSRNRYRAKRASRTRITTRTIVNANARIEDIAGMNQFSGEMAI